MKVLCVDTRLQARVVLLDLIGMDGIVQKEGEIRVEKRAVVSGVEFSGASVVYFRKLLFYFVLAARNL